MAKRRSFLDNPFGGWFDFNRDGKEDLSERWIANQVFRQFLKESDPDDTVDTSWRYTCEDGFDLGIIPEAYNSESAYMAALNEARNAWKEDCEDGSDYDVFPDDYDSEEEYMEALDEARNAWKDDCEDGSEYGLDPDDFDSEEEYNDALEEAQANNFISFVSTPCPEVSPVFDEVPQIREEDYPNKRRYNAAFALTNTFVRFCNEEYERQKNECCHFIVDCADTILAANYLSHTAGFLYAQAVKDHFTLPISLPDEDENQEFQLYQILLKIARRDIPLSFEVWNWCLEQFMPYARYDSLAAPAMSRHVIGELGSFPPDYSLALVRYMNSHPSFTRFILEADCEPSDRMTELIVVAIRDNLHPLALSIFNSTFAKIDGNWKLINKFTQYTINHCIDYRTVETIEYFRDHMFPLIKAMPIGMVQDEIPEWESKIENYIEKVIDESDVYTYTRKNAWRLSVPDGQKFGLDPRYYKTEQEYMDDLQNKKYGWRKWYENCNTLGLDVNSFETQEECEVAYTALLQEKRVHARLQREQEQQLREAKRSQALQSAIRRDLNENNIHRICGVSFGSGSHPYHYLADDLTLEIGDTVLVPVKDAETEGTVISVGTYLRSAAPFPVDRMKKIKQKV